ncbi:Branched-chain-amino-acid aminotransferase-like protein 2 [Dichanthelium oligosanthes]|uniref:Branched-chain-amino-acid aminotransferase-like protein 2 n=1 Tax=Dichanthelium oligosanthes TaxID=888268 RepID=A0A1E5WJK8_9POAL|nr:Branched-chain-amino-acid aminotransferase-like protein 2 [Dichanthelium oligosanthes]
MASSAPEGEGQGPAPVVIHAWSAPRSLSTSLMYSFAQRDDMEVLDEPLYANFLHATGVDRPYREDLLSKTDPDGNKVVKEVIFGPGEKTYRYCKTFPFAFYDLLEQSLPFYNMLKRQIKDAIFKTLIANGMFDNAHIRLTLTRGKKGKAMHATIRSNFIKWKPPVYDNSHGIKLATATTRRNSPNSIDSKIHHNNLINNILAKIEGNLAQAEDAIMLDKDGFVSETNATNIFMVKKGTVLTPHADYCLPGITRATLSESATYMPVMDLVVKENFVLHERRISLSEFHAADEVWTTGTMGEITPKKLQGIAFLSICQLLITLRKPQKRCKDGVIGDEFKYATL